MPYRLFDMRLRERREALLVAPVPAYLSWDPDVIEFLTERVCALWNCCGLSMFSLPCHDQYTALKALCDLCCMPRLTLTGSTP